MTTHCFRLCRHRRRPSRWPRPPSTRRDVGPHDVAFDIHFAGICHSDIHTVKGEWGQANYPLVPGHEIAGVVTAVGSEVTKYKVGDRVGVGCFVDSCRECEQLPGRRGAVLQARHDRHLQRASAATARPTQGGYSGAIVVDENYVLRIPDSIPLDAAAPLLCAGITLYSPLRHWNAGPGKRVAVIGLGGLGHMGVKLAHAMGAKVTVLEPVAEEDGGRPAAGRRRVLRDLRPRDVHQAGRLVRPDPEHRVGQPGPGRLPGPARRRRHAGRTGHARTSDGGRRPSRWSAAAAACPAR